MILYSILAGLLGIVLAFGAGTWLGIGLGEDKEFAKRAREDAIVQGVKDAANLGAAEAIAKNKPRNVTIRQEVEREIRTNHHYSDCRHSPDSVRSINEALTGKQEPTGDRKLPRAVATER